MFMLQNLLFFPLEKVVFYTFSSVIVVYLGFGIIKTLFNKKTTNTIYKHSKIISKLQQELWLAEKKAYYDYSSSTIVDEKGNPIKLSKYNENITLAKFIGNYLPTNAIRIGIRGYAPSKKYAFKKTFNVSLHPIAGFDTWTVKNIIADRIYLTHPIMGELTLNGISSNIKITKKVRLYQRVTYIGNDCIVQYELREN